MRKIYLLVCALFLSLGVFAQYPTVSTGDDGPWYFVQVLGSDTRVGLCMSADADSGNSVNRVFGKAFNYAPFDTAKQLWRAEKDADDNYVLINKFYNQKLSAWRWDTRNKDVAGLADEASTGWILSEPATPNGHLIFKAANPLTANSPYFHQGNDGWGFSVIFEGTQWGTGVNSQFKFIEFSELPTGDVDFGDVLLNSTTQKRVVFNNTEAVTVTTAGDAVYTFTEDEYGVVVTFAPDVERKESRASVTVGSGGQTVVINIVGYCNTPICDPTINTDVWYYVNWHRAGAGKSLTQDAGTHGDVLLPKCVTIDRSNNAKQVWKLVESTTTGRYWLQSASGEYAEPKDGFVQLVETPSVSYELKDNTSYEGVAPAYSLWTGDGTTALDHRNSGNPPVDCVATWSGESGVSKGAAVTFIQAHPSLLIADELDFGVLSLKNISSTKELSITRVNLEDNVSVVVEGSGADAFEPTLTDDVISIVFAPTVDGVYEATLKITSGDVIATTTLKGEAKDIPFAFSDENNEYWYNFGFTRQSAKSIQSEGIGMGLSQTTTDLTNVNQWWKFVGGYESFKIVNYYGDEAFVSENASNDTKVKSGNIEDARSYAYVDNNGKCLIQPVGTSTYLADYYAAGKDIAHYGSIDDAGVSLRFEEITTLPELAVNVKSITFKESVGYTVSKIIRVKGNGVDDIAIIPSEEAVFAIAQGSDWDSKVGGSLIVSFTPDVVEINKAGFINVTKGSSIETITVSCESYPFVVSTEENSYWYYIVSNASAPGRTYAYNKVMYDGGFEDSRVCFTDKSSEATNQMWRFLKSNGKLAIQNLGTGKYASITKLNISDSQSMVTVEDIGYTFEVLPSTGYEPSYAIKASNGSCFHPQSNYSVVVAWNGVSEEGNQWLFAPVDTDLTWSSSDDTNWTNAANWTPNMVPFHLSNVTIPAGKSTPVVSAITTIANLTMIGDAKIELEAELTVKGEVKVEKTVSKETWYSIGFPFAAEAYYEGFDEDPKLIPYSDTQTNADFWVKAYDGTGDVFAYTENTFAKGIGYIAQYPKYFDVTENGGESRPITYKSTSTTGVVLDGKMIEAPSSEYKLVANPTLNDIGITSKPDAGFYNYKYNSGTNSFIRVADGDQKTVAPFEAYITVLLGAGSGVEPRSIIGGDEDLTNINTFVDSEDIKEVRYYNLQGIEINNLAKGGVYIEKTTYTSGEVATRKIIK